MTPAPYLMFFNRPDFRGLNDKYLEAGSRFGITPISGVKAALAGSGVFDVLGNSIDQNYRDLVTERLARYKYQWMFYNGEHYENPWEDGERKTVRNFCKLVVDKGASFFLADGWEVKGAEGNEQVAGLLNKVWKQNNHLELTRRLLQYGGINGDCFIYVTVDTKDEFNDDLPMSKWRVKLVTLDPKFCFPFFSRTDPTEIELMMVQFPTTSADDPSASTLYTIVITSETMDVWHNENKVDTQPNPFGRVNVVHFKNGEIANSNFGASDIDEIIPLNEELNLTANSIRRTIKYHGEPTTIIFGARVSDMERGAKKIWSNLPVDAKVENLKLDGDLQHTLEHLKNIEDTIFKMGGIPKIAMEAADAFRVSNTSGIAIQMLFQPLIEKIKQKRVGFTKMVQDINKLILIAFEKIIGKDIGELADDLDELYETTVDYTSPLPRDYQAEIDQAIKLKQEGVWSVAEMIRRVGDTQNLERLVTELIADKQSELMTEYEKQRAVLGIRPSALAAFLGSPTMSEELNQLADAVAKIRGKQAPQQPTIKPTNGQKDKKPKTRVRTAA